MTVRNSSFGKMHLNLLGFWCVHRTTLLIVTAKRITNQFQHGQKTFIHLDFSRICLRSKERQTIIPPIKKFKRVFPKCTVRTTVYVKCGSSTVCLVIFPPLTEVHYRQWQWDPSHEALLVSPTTLSDRNEDRKDSHLNSVMKIIISL